MYKHKRFEFVRKNNVKIKHFNEIIQIPVGEDYKKYSSYQFSSSTNPAKVTTQTDEQVCTETPYENIALKRFRDQTG